MRERKQTVQAESPPAEISTRGHSDRFGVTGGINQSSFLPVHPPTHFHITYISRRFTESSSAHKRKSHPRRRVLNQPPFTVEHQTKMRLPIVLLFAFFTAVFALPPPQKPVVVSFPDNTPASIIDKAIAEIEKGGGIITHEYCMPRPLQRLQEDRMQVNMFTALIKGFAAKVSEDTLNKITALAEAYAPVIEDDYVVRIDGSTGSSQ
jgi:hypothetical protein